MPSTSPAKNTTQATAANPIDQLTETREEREAKQAGLDAAGNLANLKMLAPRPTDSPKEQAMRRELVRNEWERQQRRRMPLSADAGNGVLALRSKWLKSVAVWLRGYDDPRVQLRWSEQERAAHQRHKEDIRDAADQFIGWAVKLNITAGALRDCQQMDSDVYTMRYGGAKQMFDAAGVVIDSIVKEVKRRADTEPTGDAAKPVKTIRRRTVYKRGLTPRQSEAIEQYAKHHGKIKDIAKAMKVKHPVVIKFLERASAKLPADARPILAHRGTGQRKRPQRYPTDKRGQAAI